MGVIQQRHSLDPRWWLTRGTSRWKLVRRRPWPANVPRRGGGKGKREREREREGRAGRSGG